MTKEQQALYDLITTALHYKDESDSSIEFYWDSLTRPDLSEQGLQWAFQKLCKNGIIKTHNIGYKNNQHAIATGSMSARTSTPTRTHARKHYRAQIDRKKLTSFFQGKYFVSINTKTHEVLVNNRFRLSKPHFGSPNHQFIEHVLARPNGVLTREEARAAKLDMTQQFKGMIDDLGFEGELKKTFFPRISNKAIEFRNNLTKDDVERLGVDEKALQGQLDKLSKIRAARTASVGKRGK